jgi:hypothetical protein
MLTANPVNFMLFVAFVQLAFVLFGVYHSYVLSTCRFEKQDVEYIEYLEFEVTQWTRSSIFTLLLILVGLFAAWAGS